jgi:predicted ATPase
MRLRLAPRLREIGEELGHLGGEHSFAFHVAGGENAIGFADLADGRYADAVVRLARGRAGYVAAHAGYLLPAVLGALAQARAGLGELPEALGLVRCGLSLAARTEERSDEPALLQLEGELLLALEPGDRAGGEARLRHALEKAREQEAKWWELRVATSLAQLWVASGEHRTARRLLAPLYRFFTEGLDMPDLKDAQTLLDTPHPPLTVA